MSPMDRFHAGKSNALNGAGPKHRILVIDDEESILFAIKDYFDLHGFEVDCAPTVQVAESLLNKRIYSIVIVDLCLTEMSNTEGLTIVHLVHRKFPLTRIVLLTAYGSSEIEKEALREGVDAILPKPQPLPELKQIVCSLIRPSKS